MSFTPATLKTITDNITAYVIDTLDTKSTHHTTTENGYFGDHHTHKNRSNVSSSPALNTDHEGTRIAYVETGYEYRGQSWTVTADIRLHEAPHHHDNKTPVIRPGYMELHNLDNGKTFGGYGYSNPAPSEAQRTAAYAAISEILGYNTDERGNIPVTVKKTEVVAMMETAAQNTVNSETITYLNGEAKAAEYATRYRENVTHAVTKQVDPHHYTNRSDQTNTIYGNTISDEAQHRIIARIVKAHKRELTARAKAL